MELVLPEVPENPGDELPSTSNRNSGNPRADPGVQSNTETPLRGQTNSDDLGYFFKVIDQIISQYNSSSDKDNK